MKTHHTNVALSFIILVVCCYLSESAPECKSGRPGGGLNNDQRVMKVPTKTNMNGTYNMVKALCCIYTRVEMSSDVDDFILVLYDGSTEKHKANNFGDAYEKVTASICKMYMGSKDCNDGKTCVKNAMRETTTQKFKKLYRQKRKTMCGSNNILDQRQFSNKNKCIKWCFNDKTSCAGLEILETSNGDSKTYDCARYDKKPSSKSITDQVGVTCYVKKRVKKE